MMAPAGEITRTCPADPIDLNGIRLRRLEHVRRPGRRLGTALCRDNGMPLDPAQLSDFVRVAGEVLDDDRLRQRSLSV
jgi:hypothetical protein